MTFQKTQEWIDRNEAEMYMNSADEDVYSAIHSGAISYNVFMYYMQGQGAYVTATMWSQTTYDSIKSGAITEAAFLAMLSVARTGS